MTPNNRFSILNCTSRNGSINVSTNPSRPPPPPSISNPSRAYIAIAPLFHLFTLNDAISAPNSLCPNRSASRISVLPTPRRRNSSSTRSEDTNTDVFKPPSCFRIQHVHSPMIRSSATSSFFMFVSLFRRVTATIRRIDPDPRSERRTTYVSVFAVDARVVTRCIISTGK